HDCLRLLVRKFKGPDDDLRLSCADNPALVRLCQDQLEFVFREWHMSGGSMSHAVQNPGRRAFEKPQERSKNEMNGAQGARENQQVLLGVSDGEKFGDLFSQKNVQHGHDEKCGSDPARMQEPVNLILYGED